MNTPAHWVVSAVVLGRGRSASDWLPISLGAVLPDLPMFFFYLYERVWAGSSERLIWSERYFAHDWQVFFDAFNSLPLIAVGLLLARWRGWHKTFVLLISMTLHIAGDFFVHREDGHGHFFPLTRWHFMSPVSYWDPAHHGLWFAALEATGVLMGSLWLIRRGGVWRSGGALCLLLYVAYGSIALLVFSEGLAS